MGYSCAIVADNVLQHVLSSVVSGGSSNTWEHEGDRRPARLGLDAEGQLVLLVHGSGKLHCRWTLRGRRDTAGQLQFQFQLPPSGVK